MMTLLNALYRMQQVGKMCDVHLITTSGEILKSHSCVLSAASSTLENMIDLGSRDPITMIKTVPLPQGVDYETMEMLIQLIYSSNNIIHFKDSPKEEVTLSKEVTSEIIKVASLVGIEVLETISVVAAENETLIPTKKSFAANRRRKKKRSIVSNHKLRRLHASISKVHSEIPSPQPQADMDSTEIEEQNSPTFSCDECGKQFKQRKAWQLHMDEIHSSGKKNCTYCQKSFLTQQKLDRHVRRHRNRTTCTICNKSFTNDYVMQLHIRTHTGQERFSCHICDKKFPYKSSLTTHMLIHSDKKAYICSVCGKSFRQKIHAKEHESQHSGVKRYQCNDCNKSFAHQSGLKRHINDIHQKLRPFICESCGRAFSRKVKLTEHRRIHTGEKPYVCGECGTSYKSNRSLKNHKKSRHGIIVPEYETGIWKSGQENEKNKVDKEVSLKGCVVAEVSHTGEGCEMPLIHSPLVAINRSNLSCIGTSCMESQMVSTAITTPHLQILQPAISDAAESMMIPSVAVSSSLHFGQRS